MATTKVANKTATLTQEVPAQDMMPLSDIKVGGVYKLATLLTSTYGYRLEPGTHIVESRNSGERGSIVTRQVESGNRASYFPVNALPFIPVPKDEADALLAMARLRHPGQYAGFGASNHLGTDPEVFLVDGDGMVIPAFNFLGTKEASAKTGFQSSGYHNESACVPYWDGFQAEYTVKPFACIAHLTDCIQHGLKMALTRARAFNPSAKLTGQSVLPIHADTLAAATDEHVQLGCLPSLNVYGHKGSNPGDGRTLPVRFAGFHMHFNLQTGKQKEEIPSIVRMMDKLAGVLSVVALSGLEDPIRRRYYGLAGEYRLPKHGLEWRVLSSGVLWHPALVHLHFNMARCAMHLAQAGMSNLWVGSDEEAVECIDNLDVEAGKRILQANRELIIGCLQDTYFVAERPLAELTFDHIVLPGFMESITLDMEKNWVLANWSGHSGRPNCQFHDFAKRRLVALKLLTKADQLRLVGSLTTA